MPQQVKHILQVFSEIRMFIEQSLFIVLTVRNFHLSWVVLSESTIRKLYWKAHGIKILLSVVYGIFLDVHELVLLNV